MTETAQKILSDEWIVGVGVCLRMSWLSRWASSARTAINGITIAELGPARSMVRATHSSPNLHYGKSMFLFFFRSRVARPPSHPS